MKDDYDEVDAEVISTEIVPMGDTPSLAAQKAFDDYIALGQSRSITMLQRQYAARRLGDPSAPVPTIDIYQLRAWEQRYGWRQLAYEHDTQAVRVYNDKRRELLKALFKSQAKRAHMLMDVAEKAIKNINPEEMEARDAIKFLEVGMKWAKEAEENTIELNNPAADSHDSVNSVDVFDQLRNIALSQVNINIYKKED